MDFNNQVKNSLIYKTLEKLDVKEDTEILNESFLVRKVNGILHFFQTFFENYTRNSFFIKNVDIFILFAITILLANLTIATSGQIALLLLLCISLSTVKLFFKKGAKLELNSLDLPILLFIFITGLSVIFSDLFIPALKGYSKLLIYFTAYLAFYNYLKDAAEKGVFLLIVVAVTASLESVIAIYQNFSGVEALATWQDITSINPEQVMQRVYGSLKPYNPNLLAGYLIATFSACAGLFFYFSINKRFKIAAISLIGASLIILATVLTGSRGAYIALVIEILGLVMISGHIIWHDYSNNKLLKKIWLYLILGGILAGIILVIYSPALQHRIESIFTLREDSSNSFRMNVYLSSFEMLKDNWLTGIGPGSNAFRLTYGLYMVTGFDALGAYSVPLEIAVESGIPALLAFGWLIFLILFKGFKTVLFEADTKKKIIIAGCLVGITGIMAHGLVDTIFFRPQIQILFWMLVAIFAANIKHKKAPFL